MAGTDPDFKRFSSLTQAEESAGLLAEESRSAMSAAGQSF